MKANDLPTLSVDLVRAAQRSEEFSGDKSEDGLRRAADRYVKWLRLVALYPEMPLAPARDVDRMWHLHMLHPRAYAADCHRLFGFLLDHDGGFGAAPNELPVLQQVFSETAALWAAEYGEDYTGISATTETGMTKCTRNCVSRCQRACKTATPAA